MARTSIPARRADASRSLGQRMLHPFIAPFTAVRGGPHFDDCTPCHIDCGPVEIEFMLPRAYMGTGTRPIRVDLDNDATFDHTASKGRTHHDIVRLAGSNWPYWHPTLQPKQVVTRLLPLPREPYTIIGSLWQIERVRHGYTLQAGNPALLEAYLRADYDKYLNSEGGPNDRMRKEQREYGNQPEVHFSEEEIQAEIRYWSLSNPTGYESMTFNEVPWLRYKYLPTNDHGQDYDGLYYSCTLTPTTILTLDLNITCMAFGARRMENWKHALLEDTEWLLRSVKLNYRELAAD